MPRFYFDIENGEFHQDDEGATFNTLKEARIEALKTLVELARWKIGGANDPDEFRIVIRDESRVVYKVTATITTEPID